jgi:transposase
MESTGVYWRPVYAVLEGHVELIVGNARHIRNVPGRKTDVKDAEWIADLVRHGLIAKSFVPPAPLRDLRDLLRYRRKLIEAQAAERNRLLRLLETANIKLASVMSDVFGVSGRAMVKALIAGCAAPEEIAALARGQLRRKRAELIEALTGGIEEHHRFLLAMQLGRIEAIEADVAALDARIAERLLPYSAEMALLMTIPRVNWLVGAVIIAEIGTDMSVFLSVHHLRLGRRLPRQLRERGQAKEWARPQGQRPSAHDPGRRRHFRGTHQRQLSEGQVPPPQGPSRCSACRPGHCSQDCRGRLSHARRGRRLSRSRRRLSRPDR